MEKFLRKLFGLCPIGGIQHEWGHGEVIDYSMFSVTELNTCLKCGKNKITTYGAGR